MVKAIVKLEDHQDRILTILKGKYGLKNKSDAINFVIEKYEKAFLPPALRPEYGEFKEAVKLDQEIDADEPEIKGHAAMDQLRKQMAEAGLSQKE